MTDILLASSEKNPVSIELETTAASQQLILRYSDHIQAVVTLETPVELPAELFIDDPRGRRLKTLQMLRQQVADQASYAAAQLEAKWHALIAAFSHKKLVLTAEGEFLNACPFGAKVIDYSATAELNLGQCLLADAPLQASLALEAAVTAQFNTVTVNTRVRYQIAITREIPRLTLVLPTIGLALPALDFPEFNWAALQNAITLPTLSLPVFPALPITVTSDPAKVTINWDPASRELAITADLQHVTATLYGSSVDLGNLLIGITPQGVTLTTSATALAASWPAQSAMELPAPLQALKVQPGEGELHLEFAAVKNQLVVRGYLIQQLILYTRERSGPIIAVRVTQPFTEKQFVPHIDFAGQSVDQAFDIVLPTSIQIPSGIFAYLPETGSIRLTLSFANLNLDPQPLIDVLGAILSAIVSSASGLASIVGRGLQTALGQVLNTTLPVGVTLLFDARTGQLQQLLLDLHQQEEAVLFDQAGLTFATHARNELALLIDLRDGECDAYFVLTSDAAQTKLATLGIDLWFASATVERAVNPLNSNTDVQEKLLNLTLNANRAGRVSIVPFGIRHQQAVFLYGLSQPLQQAGEGVNLGFAGYRLVELADNIGCQLTLAENFKNRILPFLAVPTGNTGSTNPLQQYFTIDSVEQQIELKQGKFTTHIGVVLHGLGDDKGMSTSLTLSIDARRMSADISAGLIEIAVPESFKLFGMDVSFRDQESNKMLSTSPEFKPFVLDLRQGGRLYLKNKIDMLLTFNALGDSGVQLKVLEFVIHGAGLDLTASLDKKATITLPGLETQFTFHQGALSVNGGTLEVATLSATGKLPPALLGDVDVDLHLALGYLDNGSFGLVDGIFDLACKGKPLRCDLTHFIVTLDEIQLRFIPQGSSPMFCALISGSAEFAPRNSELTNGLLKHLADIEIEFENCPLAGPKKLPADLVNSFVIALKNPISINLFGTFVFEIRSLGFESLCPEFGPDDQTAAFVIGGQAMMSDGADVIRAECDANRLCIAPGNPGSNYLPRIRCDSWGVALRMPALELEGLVTAVDGRMPQTLVSSVADNDLKQKGYKGFMGQGRVAIQGLPALAVSFGFVEMQEPDWPAPKRAWFLYLEAQHLSYMFQLGPIPFYLREAGLGLGYHFTYVGIKALQQSNSLPDNVLLLDKISATAVEPSKLSAWAANEDDDLTVVARVMISMSSASGPNEPQVWRKEEEKSLPNLLLLNGLLAMHRSTFLMTANVWLGYSYYDWDEQREIRQNGLVGKQVLTGFVVVETARSEFLARLKSITGMEIGPRLAMPEAFKNALKETEYESTLYIRPGLLHFELGWPNRIRWTKDLGGLHVSVEGGAIFRQQDESLLVGMNLSGQLDCQISGRLDAGVVGVAVSASLTAALQARMVGYLDARDINRSFYYSLFALQVCVRFEVSAWLEIDAFLCKITVRASFAISLQLDVIAEIAFQGDASFGSRVRATIAVSIFGRTLGLSVGLGINPALVDQAASRVSRFMDLGLVQDVPAPTPTLSEQDRVNQAATEQAEGKRKARDMAATINHDSAGRAVVPHEEGSVNPIPGPKEVPGVAIGVTQFQIVLTNPQILPEMSAEAAMTPQEWVYLTFLPLDARDASFSSFYAAPQTKPVNDLATDHTIELPGLDAGQTIYCFTSGNWVEAALKPAANGRVQIATTVDWETTLLYTESNRKNGDTSGVPTEDTDFTRLENLIFSAFITRETTVKEVTEYREPAPRPQPTVGKRIAAAEYADNYQRHQRQENSYNGAISLKPADRRCYEARDFLLHKFISDLFELAKDGKLPESVNILHMGLTLLVPRAWAEKLAALSEGATVSKRIGWDFYGQSDRCDFFNPPHLTYAARKMAFNANHEWDGRRALLDWELHWDYDQQDAEHFLQHYEIVRQISFMESTDDLKTVLTIRRADQEVFEGTTGRNIVRNPWQFIDEFADLNPAIRARLVDGVEDVDIRYIITPVCISGTRSQVSHEFNIVCAGKPVIPPITLAKAELQINPITPENGGIENLSLTLDWKRDKPVKLEWRLIARGEAILPAGQYGTDGEVHTSLSRRIGVIPKPQPSDISATISVAVTPKNAVEVTDSVKPFIDALQDMTNPRSWKLYIQPVVLFADKKFPGELYPMELYLNITGGKAGMDLVTRVDGLERVCLPQSAALAAVMAPVTPEDMTVESGRAVQPEPYFNGGDLPDYRHVMHPEFSAVSRLRWNLRPAAVAGNLNAWRLLAGFDILRLNLDGKDTQTDLQAWQSLSPVSSVRLQSTQSDGLLPGTLGEANQWKVRYPAMEAGDLHVEWPYRELRETLIPEPSSGLVRTLLQKGFPNHITLQMEKPKVTDVAWVFACDAVDDEFWTLNSTNQLSPNPNWNQQVDAAESLRLVLRRLTGYPVASAEPTEKITLTPEQRRGWSLTLTPGWSADKSDADAFVETVAMNFDQPLHPLLVTVLTRMARLDEATAGERIITVDQRPPPLLKATTVNAFMQESTPQADPHGWAVLDRLGLGVTVRLHDPLRDEYLSPLALQHQLRRALASLTEKDKNRLFIHLLFKPGTLTRRVDFSVLAQQGGIFDDKNKLDALLESEGLSMVHIALRPTFSTTNNPDQFPRFYAELRAALQVEEDAAADVQANEIAQIETIWPHWSQRFTQYPTDLTQRYAFAALEAVQSQHVAPDSAGTLSMILPEADGYEHCRAFAILPVWRYANMLNAAGYGPQMDKVTQTQREQIVASGKLACVMTLIERTAPVPTPAVIALPRLGDTVWWQLPDGTRVAQQSDNAIRLGRSPGALLPVLLPHHPERQLIRSNLVVARNLAHHGMLTGGALMFADERWCLSMLPTLPDEQHHADWQGHSYSEILTEELMTQSVNALSMLNSPARVRVYKHLPHWYRHALMIAAGSGMAVSTPVVSYLADPPAWLVAGAAIGVPDDHPWAPLFRDKPSLEVCTDTGRRGPAIRLDLPAIRYRDTTDALTASLWGSPVAALADPVVSYELEIQIPPQTFQPRSTIIPLARIARTRGKATTAPNDTFSAFGLSPAWTVECHFVPDPKPTLELAITPQGTAVAYLGKQVSVAGGWNAEGLEDEIRSITQTPKADGINHVVKLFDALMQASIGEADVTFNGWRQFPRYTARMLNIQIPNPGDRDKAKAVLTLWLAALASDSRGLVRALGEMFAPHLKDFLSSDAQRLDIELPWIVEMAEPQAPFTLQAAVKQTRVLVPELMTTVQYKQAIADAGGIDEDIRLISLVREAQIHRAMAGGKVLIRALRGDVVALELPLMSLK